jgi:protein ImuB
MFACVHAQGGTPGALLECAGAFSPRVEETAAGTLVLDVRGLAHLFGSSHDLAGAIARHASELGLKASVALAANPDTAVHAARGFPGVNVISPGGEAAALGKLPVEVLDLPPEMMQIVVLWGIRTFADFAALPEAGIVERLGPEGAHFHKLARGAGDRPLVPAKAPPAFEESMELEYPVTTLEPLSFILGRLLNQICGKLESHGLATHELRLVLGLENRAAHERSFRLPFPMRDGRTFLKLLQLDLDSHPPPGPVVQVTISAEPVNPRVIQNGLFRPPAPEPQKLELMLARIANVVGEENVGSPELVDTHRPGAFRMQRFGASRTPAGRRRIHLALRMFRPPLRAKVLAPSGCPARVAARGVRGRVLSLSGPWRTSGDWWSADPWARDEWDVALSDGALYRIFLDHHNGGWFIEGSYD